VGETDLQFVICGDGEMGGAWRQQAEGLSNVLFLGWVPRDVIQVLMSMAAIGLVTYTKDAPQTLPNKPFEYFSGGLAVVSSLRGELETLLNEHSCGLTYQAGDSQSLLAALRTLACNPELRDSLGAKGRALAEGQFAAETIYPKMISHLIAIAHEYRRSGLGGQPFYSLNRTVPGKGSR
jgi:glycosyltransferase involved in cell wall biosynthesis